MSSSFLWLVFFLYTMFRFINLYIFTEILYIIWVFYWYIYLFYNFLNWIRNPAKIVLITLCMQSVKTNQIQKISTRKKINPDKKQPGKYRSYDIAWTSTSCRTLWVPVAVAVRSLRPVPHSQPGSLSRHPISKWYKALSRFLMEKGLLLNKLLVKLIVNHYSIFHFFSLSPSK